MHGRQVQGQGEQRGFNINRGRANESDGTPTPGVDNADIAILRDTKECSYPSFSENVHYIYFLKFLQKPLVLSMYSNYILHT